MAKFDFEKMKGSLQDAAGNVANAAKGAADSVANAAKGIKMPDLFAGKGANKTSEEGKEDSLPSDVPNKTEGTYSESAQKEDNPKEENSGIRVSCISTKNAIKIIYYLMAADGQIYHSEEEKFDEICMELDPDFVQKKAQIIKECKEQLDKVIDTDDYYDVVQDGVEDAIISSMRTEDSFITPKLLVWDLLSVAYSDENYDETERKLLKYIVRKLDIDKAEFLEMESSILTLMDLEKELAWIKTTDRPYLKIESMVNEIQDRKNVIFESVKDLIAL